MTTFSAIVIGVRGYYKSTNNNDYCQVIVTDEIGEEDHDTVKFTQTFHKNTLK